MTQVRRGGVVALVALALSGCLQSHDGSRQALNQTDCYTCHQPDYKETASPNANGHANADFPTSCVDCHVISGWQPALGGLHPPVVVPADDFSIETGPHADVACLDCHDITAPQPATDGANTDCVTCHPDTNEERAIHGGVSRTFTDGSIVAYADVAYASRNFCLPCHPNGFALHHPVDKFPLGRSHSRDDCIRCHDRASGNPDKDGANTNCFGVGGSGGCHSIGRMDEHHLGEVSQYSALKGDGSNPRFCLDSGCHPDGRKHD